MGVSARYLFRHARSRSELLTPSDGAARGFDVPYIFAVQTRSKQGPLISDSGPSVITRDAQPMNSQPGKLSVLPGRVGTGGVTPIVYAELLLLRVRQSRKHLGARSLQRRYHHRD